jgi:maltose alpha-D-glucosyltransferase/alpha-amylase
MSPRKKQEEDFSQDDDPLWYKDAIIYELPVRAFCDSNGDGSGDFRGLLERLDYLQDLGATALWLLPFYPSPLRDDGYDIAHYTGVHQLYGNLADFKAFLREAHRRDLKVITELVVNHTSDQHPWFQRARRAKPGTVAHDFYVWSDTSDKYKEARIIFKDFEHSNWTWDSVANAFYWHRFYSHQPDLNYDNPHVHDAIFGVVDFWLSLGIDGLRLDAVPYLYEREGTNCENLPETHVFLKELRRRVDKQFAGRMLLAEANQWPEDAAAYFGSGDECHMAFHFPVMPRLFMGIRMEDSLPILDILQQTPPIPENCQWAIFLRNHDELTLEMVTDEDRDYMYRVYAQDPEARLNLGIRRRLAPLLENHHSKIELMNGLLLSLPGTPVIYYGDEIGMGDNIYLGDRNGVRTPMQWSPDRNAGFSKANPQRLYLPAIIDPAYHYEAINVETQQNNPHSLLWWMKRLIALRKRSRAFGRGSIEFLYPDNHKVLAFLRRYRPQPGGNSHDQEECVLVVANLSRFPQCVELDLAAFKGMAPVEMLGRTQFPIIRDRPYLLTLGGHAFYWFSLEPVRTAVLQAVEEPAQTLLVQGTWDQVLNGKARETLQEILPAYLKRCRWFQGKERQTEAAMILESVALPYASQTAYLALVQVEYTEAEPETYLLALAFARGREAEKIRQARPQTVICPLRVKGDETEDVGVLYDALGEKRLSSALLEAIFRHRHFKRAGGELLGLTVRHKHALLDPRQDQALVPGPEPSPLKGEYNNTVIAFGDRWFLKIYRRIEEGTNLELELLRFLGEKASPHATPSFAGALEYRRSWGKPMTLGIVERFVAHQANGWDYACHALGLYFEHAMVRQTPAELTLPKRRLLDLLDVEPPALAQEVIGAPLGTMRLLGQRTAEIHSVLASVPEDENFAAEPFTPHYQRSLYQSLRSQARQAFAALRQRIPALPEAVQEQARRVLGKEEEILRRARFVLDHKTTAARTRCHGDYHLGQVLFTGKEFVIIDWEGQTDRPLSDRRRKRTPLRDVASMLTSFHYAVRCALASGHVRPQDISVLEPWARFWEAWVSSAFLKAYLEVALQDSFLPQSKEELRALLDFSLLKRAVNELRRELIYSPERVSVALSMLLQLTDTTAS